MTEGDNLKLYGLVLSLAGVILRYVLRIERKMTRVETFILLNTPKNKAKLQTEDTQFFKKDSP